MNFSERDKRFFDCARSMARLSSHKITRVGAVITDGKTVVSTGYNSEQTHPIQMRYNVHRNFKDINSGVSHCLHAEIAAFVKVKRKSLRGMRIYVSRLTRLGYSGLARPCPACMAAIRHYGIRDIFYTTEQGIAYEKIDC